MEETKTITLRLPLALYNEITANDTKKLNPTLIELLSRHVKERRVKNADIKDIFTPDEWAALNESLVKTTVDDILRYNSDMFAACCEEAETRCQAFSRHNIAVNDICRKIKGLTRIQVATICERLENAPIAYE